MTVDVIRSVDVRLMDGDFYIEELFSRLDQAARNNEWVAFDLETRADESNFEDWHQSSRIVSVAFSFSADQAWAVPLSHPQAPWVDGKWIQVAPQLFASLRGARLVGHNAKYDSRWVESRCGVDLSPYLAWDTMAASYLMDENQSHSLKNRASEDLGVEPWADVDLKDAEQVPWVDLALYNGLDTAHTFALHEWQKDKMRGEPALGKLLWYIHMPAVRTLSKVERNGLLLDQEETSGRWLEACEERDRLYQEFEAKVPAELASQFEPPRGKKALSLAPTSKFFRAYAQQAWPVLETTRKGQPSWDASVLKRLAKKGHEDAKILLSYRKLDKQISTYLSRWPVDVAEDGRLHATYKTTSTDTGRLSCERPNLQQVDKKLKTCFISPPGWRFVQADHSQIEVRCMAHISGDKNLKKVYQQNRDVYRETGGPIYDKAPEDLTDEERFTMKAVVLGFIYGMLPPSFVNYSRDVFGMDITLPEAVEFRNAFFRMYPGVSAYHEEQRRFVRRRGYVVSPFGRVRRLPEIHSPEQQQRWYAERQAINAPIQSMASDIVLLGINAIAEHTDPEEVRIVGTVHDSVLLEVRNEELLQEVGSLMVDPPGLLADFGVVLTVPLSAEFEVGQRWGDSERVFAVTR